MPKELIVSVNGREKKIAIIENGRVTEFYIERGEGSQGIVGNIYKGRVMRVLPGMQSAFVDIGLDRDAFLYVSDFFDEEEEFERIVVDKTKTEGADSETAARVASERIERARIERERQIETAQERAEPIAEETSDETTDDLPADLMESISSPLAAIGSLAKQAFEATAGAITSVLTGNDETRATPTSTTTSGDEGGRRRGRRNRGRRERGGFDAPTETASTTTDTHEHAATTQPGATKPTRGTQTISPQDIDTPFVAATDSFQRIIDDDEAAADAGEMFKDARLQERITDQIRGVEFDIEDTTPTAEVGSLFSSGSTSTDSSFQRIDDDDAGQDASRPTQSVQQNVATSIARLTDDFSDEETPAPMNAVQSFERISDDEKAVEAVASSDMTVAETGGRRGRAGRGAKSKKQSETVAAPAAPATIDTDAIEAEETEETPKKRRTATASRTGATASKKGAAKKSAATASKTKATASKSRSRKAKTATAGADENTGDESASGASLADAEATVKSSRSRGEFARRGGRRRRRPTGKGENGGDEARSNGNGEDAEIVNEVEETPAAVVAATIAPEPVAAPVVAAATPAAPRGRGGREGGGGGRGGERGRGDDNRGGDNRGDGGRGGDNRGGDGGGRSSGGGGGRGDRRERSQPTITDLLREGQEIIVQIAKEPIAQKGARITSHIALPGRFLVYMPTIEHVGVSRKIESDSERQRLRKLIQAIIREEDVPSGGFIVRTAGVGMTEQDLRDDARYLIRTWRDIRRASEKSKAPSLAHKDLDLVQRILRDQLSDDFTAIRVDSEEEYLGVVEFINRIQPRLVNRVKLYTREKPILEEYGVQAEIEKAIKPRVWLRSGGYLVINQTEALVAIDVNTGKFVGRGGSRLEDTITRTNMEAVDEIARQIRLRDLGGIIVLDLIDMEDRRNRNRVMAALQDALRDDKSPTKVLSFNDFGLVIMTRKRVKQSLERTLCSPCPYCQGSSLVKSPQTVCYEILEEARSLARSHANERIKQTTLRVNPEVARALRTTERDVLAEIEDYLGAVDVTSDDHVHQEQFDFALI
ncbi:MAG TPA: Rne/Rng family ribonuclease [Pyrinomonadaceae bacterium]|jgi:ribonuclease G